MKVIDPGHVYELSWLDGQPQGPAGFEEKGCPYYCAPDNQLTFVKREGEKYPGNVGSHPGTTMQEVLRALIDRVKYVHKQEWDFNNTTLLNELRHCIYLLEDRAARKHHRILPDLGEQDIETFPVCPKCGHIGCEGACHP